RALRLTERSLADDKTEQENIRRRLQEGGRRRSPGKIKIIRLPFFSGSKKDELNYTLLLPLETGKLVRYLRSNGFSMEQDDLGVRILSDTFSRKQNGKISTDLFLDEKRIVRYLHGHRDGKVEKALREAGRKTVFRGYDVILFSMPEEYVNNSALLFALALASHILRRYNPVIILGGITGPVPSLLREHGDVFDFIVQGHGEKPLFRILTSLEYGQTTREIARDAGWKRIVSHHIGAGLFGPDYRGLPLEKYGYRNVRRTQTSDREAGEIIEAFNHSGIRISKYELMEGCPCRCVFCTSSGKVMQRITAPDEAAAALSRLKRTYGLGGFFFLSDTLNVSKEYLHRFCDALISRRAGILWFDCARADN
ncbi:MAG TPA: hypothetical protein VJC03_09120, partial [bacterium]|nr:hypothetical protein [bacterium]